MTMEVSLVSFIDIPAESTHRVARLEFGVTLRSGTEFPNHVVAPIEMIVTDELRDEQFKFRVPGSRPKVRTVRTSDSSSRTSASGCLYGCLAQATVGCRAA